MKLGKKPARKGAIKFLLTRYVDFSKYPPPPKNFGSFGNTQYQMFDNDRYGCCVWAGAANETIDWNLDAGRRVEIRTRDVLADYAAVTGFDPRDPETDQGTDMGQAASYRRKTGILDAKGNRHKIYAYARLPLGRINDLKKAMYYFGGAGVGLMLPESAMRQFDAGKPWSVVSRSPILGGHYVAGLGWQGSKLVLVTWGKYHLASAGFIKRYADELIFYLDPSRMVKNMSPEGLHLDKLEQDIGAVNAS